jgi:uncharacterized protein Yka (UPF0111/DUF47 family)
VRSAELLADLANEGEHRNNELVTAIIEAEHEGDQITHETLDRLARSNFAPIDREDIYDLVSRIDDVVDRRLTLMSLSGWSRVCTTTSNCTSLFSKSLTRHSCRLEKRWIFGGQGMHEHGFDRFRRNVAQATSLSCY